jgi:two-component system response regulator
MENSVIEILLIEDDHDDAEFTIHALRKNNLANNLRHIDNGEEALDFLYDSRNASPKIILLDLRMPRVDGIQILRKLKSDREKSQIPVIVMVSSMDGKNYVESFKVRADAYITKPMDFKKFFNAIADLGLTWTILSTPEFKGQQV